jgi:glycosyltransferase involved in cell wall biosynthesis
MSQVCVVILTFNSEASLEYVVRSCKGLASRIVVVDSFSKDGTVELAGKLGCEVLQHEFSNYSAQRNWSQDAIASPEGWYLHLDADEVLTAELRTAIQTALAAPTADGYMMRRAPYFLGRPIRHGAINPTWHLRLYKVGKGRCEDRLYDQHYLCDGPVEKLTGALLDLQIVNLESWTASHNRWSTAEAAEVMASTTVREGQQLEASLGPDPRSRKRWLKERIWYRMPLFMRAWLFFNYSYFLKLGFLDGKPGLIYHFLQAFWFRFLVDAKLYEARSAESNWSDLRRELDTDLPSSN